MCTSNERALTRHACHVSLAPSGCTRFHRYARPLIAGAIKKEDIAIFERARAGDISVHAASVASFAEARPHASYRPTSTFLANQRPNLIKTYAKPSGIVHASLKWMTPSWFCRFCMRLRKETEGKLLPGGVGGG